MESPRRASGVRAIAQREALPRGRTDWPAGAKYGLEPGFLSRRNPTDFGARQIEHQSCRIKDEPDNRIRDLVGVNRATGTERYNCHRSVDTDFPPSAGFETGKC